MQNCALNLLTGEIRAPSREDNLSLHAGYALVFLYIKNVKGKMTDKCKEITRDIDKSFETLLVTRVQWCGLIPIFHENIFPFCFFIIVVQI